MDGISKEAYLKASQDLKDEMMFDMIEGLYKKLDEHTAKCPLRKSVNRLWMVALGIPGLLGVLIIIVKFVG